MRPTILTFTRYYLPGYRGGGPIRALANLVEKLGDTFQFRIITLDRDLGDNGRYAGVQPGTWMPCGKALVRYVSLDYFGFRQVAGIVRNTPHDVIYLNSFFDPRFTQQVLVCRRLGCFEKCPIVIAPRGEFSEGALLLKRRKKRLFIRLAKLFGLYDNLTWQASSEAEADQIERLFLVRHTAPFLGKIKVSVRVAPDLTEPAENKVSALPEREGYRLGYPLRICFISRISPMKNLDFALRVLSEVSLPVVFFIYGPIEDAAYWAVCQTLARKLPSHIEVIYKGVVKPCDVVKTLAQHNLFLFPTRGENFGHVIYEALCAGLPILISDQTPWRDLEQQGVGWDLSLADTHSFARMIEKVGGWTCTEYRQWAMRARDIAKKVGEDVSIVEANERLFMEVIEHVTFRSGLAAKQR